MKKIIKSIIAVSILLTGTKAFAAAKKSIVCKSFPEYDWIMNILGNMASDFDVTLLQNNGTDLHSYQASFKDIAKISTSDLFVYVGGENDEWVETVISSAKNKNLKAFSLLENLGDMVKEEEVVEGMQAEEHEQEEETEYDEHVWLSLHNAAYLTEKLSEVIQELNPSNSETYKSNTEAYIGKLNALDKQYKAAVEKAQIKTVLFADRFPFRYLTDDYGLNYFAAFTGCSAESEASFETVVFLSKKIDELKLKTVLTIEKSNKKLADTVIANTKSKKLQVLEMDSLQSITQKEFKNGRNYLSAMTNNLEVLKKALQ